jgi:predicted molibdopterin-dependent oxidoreductase YjgC
MHDNNLYEKGCIMRIEHHPILDDLPQRKSLQIFIDGKAIDALEGESIASAMYAAGLRVHRITPKHGEPRGVFCNIGRCTDCIMIVDGQPNVRTCVTVVKDGMRVETLKGLGSWGGNT